MHTPAVGILSGSHVPVYTSRFFGAVNPEMGQSLHAKRLALACDIDLANRVVSPSPSAYDPHLVNSSPPFPYHGIPVNSPAFFDGGYGRLVWVDNEWIKEGLIVELSTFVIG